MITPENTSFFTAIVSAIKSRSGTNDNPIKYLKCDNPVFVQFNIRKNEFLICDKKYSIPCKLSKRALLWFKMYNDNMNLNDIDGKCIVLKEYSLHSSLLNSKVQIYLKIYLFSPLTEIESRNLKYSLKTAKNIVDTKELKPYLEILQKDHLRKVLVKKIEDVPNLEDILKGKNRKKHEKKVLIVKGDNEEDDEIIEFNKIFKEEKNITDDVELLLDKDKKAKGIIKFGSERNIERNKLLSKIVSKLSDKDLIDLLREHGTLKPEKTYTKSSTKSREVRRDVKEMVRVTSKSRKRKAPEGIKSSKEKGKKKAAIEIEAKKEAVTIKRKGIEIKIKRNMLMKTRSKSRYKKH